MKRYLSLLLMVVLLSGAFAMSAQAAGKSSVGIVEQEFGTVDFYTCYPGFVFYNGSSPSTTDDMDGLSIGEWLETAGTYEFIVENCEEYVSLRKEPSTNSERIEKLWLSEWGYAIGYWNGWTLCDADGRYGWVLSKYLNVYEYNEEDEHDGCCSLEDIDLCEITSAYATSTLKDKYGIYPALNAYDGNLSTAWAEGASGFGYGESITFNFDYCQVAELEIYAGYQKDTNRYTRNNRPSKIAVYLDGNYAGTYSLDDVEDVQTVVLDEAAYASELTIEILDVYSGSKYDDTCISEVNIYYFIY